MNWLWTKDSSWQKKWDAFLKSDERGHHLQFSDWLKSYASYNFDYEILIGTEDNDIKIGLGIVKAKFSFFKFIIAPYGPIISQGYEAFFDDCIAMLLDKAKKEKSCYCHINPAVSKNHISPHIVARDLIKPNSILFTGKEGNKFSYVSSVNGFNWIDLSGFNNESDLLDTLKAKTRRDIRSSYRKGLTLKFLQNENEIKTGYDLIEENARAARYSVRKWDDFKPTLINTIKKQNGYMLGAFLNGQIKGAIFLLNAGKRLTYIMGGTKKEKPDLLVGYFLQWEALKLSLKLNYPGYDISVGGSGGVKKFKENFGASRKVAIPTYYWILNPFYFSLYKWLIPLIAKNKHIVSGIIKLLKK